MKPEHRDALITAMKTELPDEPALRKFFDPFRRGVVVILKPPPPRPAPKIPDEAVKEIVQDAVDQRWMRELVQELDRRFPKNPTFVALKKVSDRDVLDASPFPGFLPLAQELIRAMATLFPKREDAVDFAKGFGVDPLDVPDGMLSKRELWRFLLETTSREGQTREMVAAAVLRFPKNKEATPVLEDLLGDVVVPTNPAPRPEDGAAFVEGSDDVSLDEALLFYEDLTLPAGRMPALLASIERVLAKSRAVCLLTVETVEGKYYGTGFRISSDLILTNHHVLVSCGCPAIGVDVDFDFDVDRDNQPLKTIRKTWVAGSVVSEAEDDWGVVRVEGLDDTVPIVELAHGATPKVGELTYILQHPGGRQKRLGFVRNKISDLNDQVVHYLTDTEPGSSGSPVFDGDGNVIALHHRGGKPQTAVGGAPVTKNEGIRISRVLERLRDRGLVPKG